MSQQKDHFLGLLSKFNQGMLVTHTADGEIHARPMALAQVDDAGDLWLVSDVHSGKVRELQRDARASITMQDGQRYLSVNGKCEVVRDTELVNSLWNEAWRVWFPKGPTDSNLVLLQLKTTRGEYWDNSGSNAVKFLYQAAKAYVTGERLETADDDQQGKVRLQS